MQCFQRPRWENTVEGVHGTILSRAVGGAVGDDNHDTSHVWRTGGGHYRDKNFAWVILLNPHTHSMMQHLTT